MRVLEKCEPKKVFYYFEEICGIPHGSGNTKEISDYLVNFAKEHGQEGFASLKKTTSRHTEDAWQIINNAARPNANELHNIAYNEQVGTFISNGKNRHIVTELIPDPKITVHQSELRGTPDPGDVTVHIDTDAFAQTHFTPGQVQTYVKQKANVNQWVTEGRYDIYA